MKRLYKAFDNFMDRLGESDHFLRCAWIFVCVAINAAIGGLIGKGVGELLNAIPFTSSPTVVHTSMLYGMVGMGGIVLMGTVVGYKYLWAMSGPNLPTTKTQTAADNARVNAKVIDQLDLQQAPVA